MKRICLIFGIVLIAGTLGLIIFELIPLSTQSDVGTYEVPCVVLPPTASNTPQPDCSAAEDSARLSAIANRRSDHLHAIWLDSVGLVPGVVLVYFGYKKKKLV